MQPLRRLTYSRLISFSQYTPFGCDLSARFFQKPLFHQIFRKLYLNVTQCCDDLGDTFTVSVSVNALFRDMGYAFFGNFSYELLNGWLVMDRHVSLPS